MIADTVLLLIIAAVFSSLKVGVKADRVLSWLLFAFVAVVFANFYQNRNLAPEEVFSFVWNSSASGDITVDIVSDLYNRVLVLPFLLITGLAIGFNAVFRYEERRGAYDSILLFNLIALVMMITSNNFVQLLTGLFAIDILAQLLVHDVEKSKYYALTNLFSDMLLFMVLAVMNSQQETLNLLSIGQYQKTPEHADFVAIVGLIAIFIKLACVPFYSGIMKLQGIRFHRLQNVLFLTSPVAGVILLLKFNQLWSVSPLFSVFVQIICVLSLIWGGICSLLSENLKRKIIFLQMMFWSLMVYLLNGSDFRWSDEYSGLLVGGYLSVSFVYFCYYYHNRIENMLKIHGFSSVSVLPLQVAFIMFAIVFALMVGIVDKVYGEENRLFIWLFAVLYITSVGVMWKQLCCKNSVAESKHATALRGVLMCAIALPVMWELEQMANESFVVYALTAVLFVMFVLPNPQIICKAYENEKIQNADVFAKIYHTMLTKPLQELSRMLSIMVDKMFIEKVVIGAVVLFLQEAIRLFRNVHSKHWLGAIIAMWIVVALMVISYWNGDLGL